MPAKAQIKSSEEQTRMPAVFDDLPFHLPRVFYAFLGLVERRLLATGLDKHLRPGMPTILFALYEEDDCILKQLKQRVMLAHNTLSTLLRRMEEAGLVKCRPCEEDGRATRVRLTKLGRSLEKTGARLSSRHYQDPGGIVYQGGSRDIEAIAWAVV
jgi:DNA-binding MarR family transcriptional regulator